MRLLIAALPLLLAASAVLAAPTEPTPEDAVPTWIETFTEIITHTRIVDVTEPSISGYPADNEEMLAAAKKRVAELQTNLTHAQEVVAILAAARREVLATVAADPAAPEATAATNATSRQCTCTEADACRKESDAEMGTCMNDCYTHIESFGNETKKYSECFTKQNATILAAEECLFDKKSYCTADKTEKTIDTTNWDELTAVEYTAEVTKENNNTIWKKHEPAYTKLQSFFTCTKNCMHKKFAACSTTATCSVQMPELAEFEKKMVTCTKKNIKITTALLNTCTCLAWTNKVKELQGSCMYFGNQIYVDKA